MHIVDSKDLAYECNGERVDRAAFYAIACDPARNVAVEACAGAGKTWMLVSRILRALLEGCPPHEILAITFTKKAASEMRQRLHEWGVEFSLADTAELELQLKMRGVVAQGAELDAQVAALKQLQRQLLSHGRPIQIRTFHSWFGAILSTAPLALSAELGLPSNYELLEDDAPAVRQVWPRFYQTLLQQPSALADFEAVVAHYGRSQTHKALEQALARRVEFSLADVQGVIDASVPSWQQQFTALLAHQNTHLTPEITTPKDWLLASQQATVLAQAARILGRASAVTFAAKGAELERSLSEQNAAGIQIALLTKDNQARKFGSKIVEIAQVQDAQALVLQYLEMQAQYEAWDYQQRMARLTRLLIAEFAALKRERNWVDMNDVECAAQRMLSDHNLSGWLQERLDARIAHLLIDEFQDTSPLQWQALHAWLSGYAGAGGGASGQRANSGPSVFMVGDPKQSIYRFRRAEPLVFKAAQGFIQQGLNGDLLSCDHTHRNAYAITHLVNQTLLAAQAAEQYADYRVHTTESRDAGNLLCLPLVLRNPQAMQTLPATENLAENRTTSHSADTGNLNDAGVVWRDSLTQPRSDVEQTLQAQECAQVARWIDGQIKANGLNPHDVMVLSRKRSRLTVMQEALRDLHIPAQQIEKNDLGAMPAVQDVLALLDVLVSPEHDLALARALKSPLFGMDDADLVALAVLQRAARTSLADSNIAPSKASTAWFNLLLNSPDLSPKLQALVPVLAQYKSWLENLPPHDALNAIFQHGDVLARYAKAVPASLRRGVLTDLKALLAASLEWDGGRYLTAYAFIRAVKAGRIPAHSQAQTDAIRLLTIHAAKGLEARVVVMLDTHVAPPKAQTMGVLIDWPGESTAPLRFIFLASETRPPVCVQVALAVEQAARAREELNMLYVAMTRARSQLVLSAVESFRDIEQSWWTRLQAACPILVDTSANQIEMQPKSAASSTFSLPVLPCVVVPQAAVLSTKEISEGRQFAAQANLEEGAAPVFTASPQARLGLAMHRLLEWYPTQTRSNQAAAKSVFNESQQRAVMHQFALTPEQLQQAHQTAMCIVQGEGAWIWDSAVVDWHGNEVPLVYQGEWLRLDRLVRHRETQAWWVLDYKSAFEPELQPALLSQLAGYRLALEKMQPDDVIKAAFLTGKGTLVMLDDVA